MFDILRVGVCHGLCRGCGSGRSGLPPADTERSLRDGVYGCFGERYVLMSGPSIPQCGTFAGACVVRHSERRQKPCSVVRGGKYSAVFGF